MTEEQTKTIESLQDQLLSTLGIIYPNARRSQVKGLIENHFNAVIMNAETLNTVGSADGLKMPALNSTVNYVPTASEAHNFGVKPAKEGEPPIMTGVVIERTEDPEKPITLKCEPRPGNQWATGAHYSEEKKPGTWHYPDGAAWVAPQEPAADPNQGTGEGNQEAAQAPATDPNQGTGEHGTGEHGPADPEA